MARKVHPRIPYSQSLKNFWVILVAQTTDQNHPNYHLWGGAGITMCPEWSSDRERFCSEMGERPEGSNIQSTRFTIRDPKLPLSKENCYWKVKYKIDQKPVKQRDPMDEAHRAFGIRLGWYRNVYSSLSPKQLAEKLGWTIWKLRAVEQGCSILTIYEAIKLAEFMEMDMSKFAEFFRQS